MQSELERILTVDSALTLAALVVVAGAIGAIYGAMHTDPVSRMLEAALMCAFGGIVSRAFVAVLLAWGDGSHVAGILIGWGFFLVPGAIDTVAVIIAKIGDGPVHYPATSSTVLLAIALVVGAAVGAGHGTLRTYDFNSIGPVQFVGDLTWGLCGSSISMLLLIYNTFGGTRPPATDSDESRGGANRFTHGFHFPGKPDFAFTQGATMSNLTDGPGTSLWVHERTHVFQSRVFGPLYTVSYLGWMAIFLFVTPFIALARKQNVLQSIQSVCYFSNPWETWAYYRQRRIDNQTPANDSREYFCHGTQLPEVAVAVLGVPVILGFAVLPVLLLV